MILHALVFALQVADVATEVNVRDGDRTIRVPIVFTKSGALLKASEILPPLGIRLSRPGRDRATIEAGTTRFDLTLGLPFARIGSQTVPLSVAPVERQGEVFIPVVLITELLPRFAPAYSYDKSRHQISRFTPRLVVPAPTVAQRPRSPGGGTSAAANKAPRKVLVVVDAGHGGPDRGMSGPIGGRTKIHEADITLAVSKRLRDELKARGVSVVMTRTTDTLIALADRGRIANVANATLFLSIHVNAANLRWPNPRGARGFETYFLSDAKTEDDKRVEEMENDADRYAVQSTAEPGDPLNFLLNDMIQNEYLRESSQLAEAIQSGMRRVHPSGIDRGVKQAGFRVLVTAHRPAVLIELGFGTNAAEAQYLASARGQQALAAAIASATTTYIAEYERRASASLGGGTR